MKLKMQRWVESTMKHCKKGLSSQGIEILLIACDEAMADESIELEQQPRTQATDDDEEVYHEAEEGGEAAFDDVGEVNAVGAVGAQGGEEGVLGDDEDDIEFVESRPGASSSAMAGQAQYGDATGEGEYEEGDEEEGEGEEDYEREAEDYASTTHHLVGGKRPGIQPSTALAGRMGVQHDEDFAKRVVHVATRERGWQPDEVGDVVSLLFSTLHYEERPQKVHAFLKSSNAPIEDPGFFASLNRDMIWVVDRDIVSLCNVLEKEEFCASMPRYVAERVVNLIAPGTVDQLVQVVLSREDMDANDMLETLRQLVEAAPDQYGRRALVLAVDRGVDNAEMKQRFIQLVPGAEAFLNEEGRADKPISIDDESDDDQPRDATEPEQFGVLEEEGNDEGPIMPPQHSLSRASSVEVLTEVGGEANGHTSVARAGEEPPLDAAEGEDDPEMLERIESMKRKWPGNEEDEENDGPDQYRLKATSMGELAGDVDDGPVLTKEDSLAILDD